MYKYGDHHVPACTKAALTRRGTPKHAHVCRLYYIYIYIYIYIYLLNLLYIYIYINHQNNQVTTFRVLYMPYMYISVAIVVAFSYKLY